MDAKRGAAPSKGGSAIAKLRLMETPRHALPVVNDAIPGWNRLIADWAAS